MMQLTPLSPIIAVVYLISLKSTFADSDRNNDMANLFQRVDSKKYFQAGNSGSMKPVAGHPDDHDHGSELSNEKDDPWVIYDGHFETDTWDKFSIRRRPYKPYSPPPQEYLPELLYRESLKSESEDGTEEPVATTETSEAYTREEEEHSVPLFRNELWSQDEKSSDSSDGGFSDAEKLSLEIMRHDGKPSSSNAVSSSLYQDNALYFNTGNNLPTSATFGHNSKGTKHTKKQQPRKFSRSHKLKINTIDEYYAFPHEQIYDVEEPTTPIPRRSATPVTEYSKDIFSKEPNSMNYNVGTLNPGNVAAKINKFGTAEQSIAGGIQEDPTTYVPTRSNSPEIKDSKDVSRKEHDSVNNYIGMFNPAHAGATTTKVKTTTTPIPTMSSTAITEHSEDIFSTELDNIELFNLGNSAANRNKIKAVSISNAGDAVENEIRKSIIVTFKPGFGEQSPLEAPLITGTTLGPSDYLAMPVNIYLKPAASSIPPKSMSGVALFVKSKNPTIEDPAHATEKPTVEFSEHNVELPLDVFSAITDEATHEIRRVATDKSQNILIPESTRKSETSNKSIPENTDFMAKSQVKESSGNVSTDPKMLESDSSAEGNSGSGNSQKKFKKRVSTLLSLLRAIISIKTGTYDL